MLERTSGSAKQKYTTFIIHQDSKQMKTIEELQITLLVLAK